ncbi:hypothetical protein IMG5_165630 [Ichthyophthirius multifiliis]|uniref:Dpy-30 motif protein n=1 Tax=Ichthyophthirius multifiliis TaxID=5932 RepID=G0R0M3_ICHMU|nr:hypothetical protein IMG5_165630 [Ichthyophthirius multifiliis]EGR28967.1 hypothetical protein IMG5_165630 [Ichthyophthirius multifiliis]|eukprot:XP_004030203.1 hypothetical protein IMG5_165630 [Ichthyophthirius multifiliis]
MNKKEENKPPNKKLILHFDINRTILLGDKVKGVSKDEHLHQILAGYSWGRLEQKDEKSPVQWKLYHPHYSIQQPEKDMLSYKLNIKKKIHLKINRQYAETVYPLKTKEEEQNHENLIKNNDFMIQNRNNLYLNFVKTGMPGIKLKPEYDRIIKSVTLPKTAKLQEEDQGGQFSQQAFQHNDEEKIIDLLSDGRYFIIPSFFRTMINLKKQKREFAIIFRTFGEDINDVVKELNSFCAGEHPCFNGRNGTVLVKFDGSKNNKNYKIKNSHLGSFYRPQDNVEECTLILGTSKKLQPGITDLEQFYQNEITKQQVKFYKGSHQIYTITQELLKESCAIAIIDDWYNWNKNGEKYNFSKTLFIDQTDYLTQHIFFDDNITEDDQCIVDTIDAVKGTRIPIKKSINKYLVRVNMLDVLKDPDFFLKSIELCEKQRAEEIERIEKQIPFPIVSFEDSQHEQQYKKSEFEQMQELDDTNYLRRAIVPLLLPALKLCDQERPEDPISLIALYCLKNKDKIKIPVPPPEYFEKDKQKEEKEQNKNQEVV